MRAVLLLLLASCTVSVPLTGKRCALSEPRCLPGYVCVDEACVLPGGADGGEDGGVDAGCPLDVDPAASACTGLTWFLSAAGSDSADGHSPGAARRTLPAGVAPGDVVRLVAGTWSATQVPRFGLSGSAACPVLITGEPDAGTVLEGTLSLEGAYLVVRDLVFSPQDEDAVQVSGNSSHLTFQLDAFRSRSPPSAFPTDLFLAPCSDCTVQECVFQSADGVRPVDVTGAGFTFRGNQVDFTQSAGCSFDGTGTVVEGNDFSGTFNDSQLTFATAGARLVGNVFHDITAFFPDKVMVRGPVRVSRNTFVRISGNDSAPLVQGSRFDDNLVSVSQWVVGSLAPSGGDFNIFDPSVSRPYSDFDGGLAGSDRIAGVDFERGGFVPLAGSAAIDGADPALPVPPGGGARADVGAIERGAQRLPDGRYCLADGGL